MSINGNLAQAARHLGNVQFGTSSAKSSARLSAAGTLVQAIAKSGAEDAEDKAKSLFDTFKESVELGNGLERAAQDSQDAMRKQKIELMAKRIEQLKELLRFATPEQAKRMLKELKQLSREFKSVSKELGSSAEGLASAASSGNLQSTTSVSSTPSSVTGTGSTASGTDQEPRRTEPVSAPNRTADPSTEESASANEDEKQPGWQVELSAAISSYTQSQLESEETYSTTRRERLKQDKEDLGKIASSLEQLADALERLADDDKDARKDLKNIRNNLEDGVDALRDVDLAGSPVSSMLIATQVSTAGSISFQSTNIVI
ncbi:hypothetical protein [Roseibium sp.]|uniref:hypothetical protein n=1 Tax=Roseibium sp. TaxID=1936156 RepID=UPI003BAEAB43